jgi:DNA-3-methyladenine glycosylase
MISELNTDAKTAARRLLGCILERTVDGRTLSGKIVETEAYDQTDEASHSYRGRTDRTRVMFGPAGYLYVYFTYGMHFCCNVVVGEDGYGAAVLIRALEPIEGQDIMRLQRHDRPDLTNGPAKLCQALSINKADNGTDLTRGSIRLRMKPPEPKKAVVQTTRIGISRGQEVPWRFYLKDNQYVSKTV